MISFVLFSLEASQPRMDFNIFKFFYWGARKISSSYTMHGPSFNQFCSDALDDQ